MVYKKCTEEAYATQQNPNRKRWKISIWRENGTEMLSVYITSCIMYVEKDTCVYMKL